MSTEGSAAHFASRINTKFRLYITPEIFVTLGLTVAVVYLLREVLIGGFTTNIGLNGTIISAFFYALYLVLRNNFELFRLSQFLQKVEEVEITPDFDKNDVHELREELTKSGHLIDSQATYAVISKMKKNGFFFPTNEDARVIKSSLGNRLRLRRGHVSFLASVLVTLGLIGTFWGLILTITSIGETMVGISQSFSSEGGDLDLGALISGISKPLGGMGVAFSSSLYGLAGSLVIGVLSTLANRAQNKFIERFSRWVDEHIPEINYELAERIKDENNLPVEINQDQNDLIKAFAVLAQETHQQLRSLGGHIKDMVEINRGQLQTQDRLCNEIVEMKQTHTSLAQSLSTWQQTQSETNESLGQISSTISNVSKHFSSSQKEIAQNVLEMSKHIKESSGHIEVKLLDLLTTQSDMLATQKTSTDKITESHSALESLVGETKQAQQVQENLAKAVYDVSKEINEANKEFSRTQSELYDQTERVCANLVRIDENQSSSSTSLYQVSQQLNNINEKLLDNIQKFEHITSAQQESIAEKLDKTSNFIKGNSNTMNALNSHMESFSNNHKENTNQLSAIVEHLTDINDKYTNTLHLFSNGNINLKNKKQYEKLESEYKNNTAEELISNNTEKSSFFKIFKKSDK